MSIALAAGLPPIAAGPDGVIRVRGTRVTLDTIVAAFKHGATAEEIVQQYPSTALADIYQSIGYYLHHTEEIESYLEGRRLAAAEVQRVNEARWPGEGMRERLLARRKP